MKIHFAQLQKQYPVFRYVGYRYELQSEGLAMTIAFEIGEHKFFPKLLLRGVEQGQLDRLGKAGLDNFVFHLGLVEIPSYWKLTCSPTILIEAGPLDTMQEGFWKKLIEKGMGEFFFVNDILPFSPKIQVSYEGKAPGGEAKLPPLHDSKKVLVPVGGGKDSIVSMELMKKAGKDLTFFTIGKDQATEDIIAVFEGKYGKTARIQLDRLLDPTLLELNARGYLNGHTPFSSIVAFNSVFTAALFKLPYIVLSNERSANEETGVYHGVNINHQYSKTFEFESDFHAYVNHTFPGAPLYFSLLRPLYEIQIMKIFAKFPEYFSVFRSCNIGKKTNSWCGTCAKCLFVSLLLSAFLPPKTVTQVFGKDLLTDAELVPLLKQLTGDALMKAFECVGTKLETLVSLYLVWKRRRHEVPLPAVLASYQEYLAEHASELEDQKQELLGSFDEDHLIPENFTKVVQDAIV